MADDRFADGGLVRALTEMRSYTFLCANETEELI